MFVSVYFGSLRAYSLSVIDRARRIEMSQSGSTWFRQYVPRLLCLGLVLAFVFAASVRAWAQAISGDIVGTVVDKSSAAIPNATVVAVNVATNFKSSVTTNTQGEYRFANLPSGTYDITATASGFSGKTLKGFVLELNKTATARLALDVAQVATTVEVTAAGAAIDTSTAQLSTTYDAKQLEDLPGSATNGQAGGVLNLSLLQAGVGSAGSVGAGTGPSIGGQRPRNNNFTIDGADNNNKGVTGPLLYVPNDAVNEFSILQNQFSPEFGHSSGGQFNIGIKSGTNTFHGRLYEYFQNRKLNAVDYDLSNQGITHNPRYDNNRFGGQLGGPVVRNKLFFFAGYEYNPVGQSTPPSSPLLAPTAAGYATLATIPGVSANNINVLKQFALASTACAGQAVCPAGGTLAVAGTPVSVGILQVAGANYYNFKTLTTSMDFNISGKDQLRGRYIYNDVAQIDNNANLPVFFIIEPFKYHLASISEYHQFSPMVTNEFRVAYTRYFTTTPVTNTTFTGLDAFPNITIDNLGGINVGPDPNAPQFTIQNTYQIVNNLGWNKGAHSLKFGIEYRQYISPQTFVQRGRGDYDYTSLEQYALDQVPSTLGERSLGGAVYSGNQNAIYWYVNDTWKVRPNLSLNLGVRYEYTSTPAGWKLQAQNSISDVPGVLTFRSPQAPKTNFMPRIGIAWSPGSSGNNLDPCRLRHQLRRLIRQYRYIVASASSGRDDDRLSGRSTLSTGELPGEWGY
jgi:hypothetical protein